MILLSRIPRGMRDSFRLVDRATLPLRRGAWHGQLYATRRTAATPCVEWMCVRQKNRTVRSKSRYVTSYGAHREQT